MRQRTKLVFCEELKPPHQLPNPFYKHRLERETARVYVYRARIRLVRLQSDKLEVAAQTRNAATHRMFGNGLLINGNFADSVGKQHCLNVQQTKEKIKVGEWMPWGKERTAE